MLDINKYYDFSKKDFITNEEDFKNALYDVILQEYKRDIRRDINRSIPYIELDNVHKPLKHKFIPYKRIIPKLKDYQNKLKGRFARTQAYPGIVNELNKRIDKLLDELKAKKVSRDTIESVVMMTYEGYGNDNNPYRDIMINIRRLVRSINLVLVTKGTYCYKTNTITLYLKNIFTHEEVIDNRDDLLSTLIHEAEHMIHLTLIHINGTKIKKTKEHNIVIESYASFKEYRYLKHNLNNEKLAERLFRSWEEHDISVFPYSGALYLHGGSNKYFNYINYRTNLKPVQRLFEDSLLDMDIAYEDIIMFKRLYEINEGYGRVIF